MLPKTIDTSKAQTACRCLLGAFMLLAGAGHLTLKRQEFQAQVPNWVPLDPDVVVLASGFAELSLGLAMLLIGGYKTWVGVVLAVFFVLIFPGNIAQFTNQVDAFGLDTDQKRFYRLFFQPVLILWTLWSTGALRVFVSREKS